MVLFICGTGFAGELDLVEVAGKAVDTRGATCACEL